jgi:hypothetical protein
MEKKMFKVSTHDLTDGNKVKEFITAAFSHYQALMKIMAGEDFFGKNKLAELTDITPLTDGENEVKTMEFHFQEIRNGIQHTVDVKTLADDAYVEINRPDIHQCLGGNNTLRIDVEKMLDDADTDCDIKDWVLTTVTALAEHCGFRSSDGSYIIETYNDGEWKLELHDSIDTLKCVFRGNKDEVTMHLFALPHYTVGVNGALVYELEITTDELVWEDKLYDIETGLIKDTRARLHSAIIYAEPVGFTKVD